MPWVKDFDVDEAVDRAMAVFWAKGYEAASIAELAEAMRINKGSLYNAFGSKKDLFTRALVKYDRQNRQAALKQLEAMDDPVAAIRTLFDGMISEAQSDAEKRGCFLVNTALDLPNHTPDVQKMVTAALDDLEQFFVRMIKRAQDRGEVPAHLDKRKAAKSLLAQVVGLRVLARGAFDSKGLKAIRSQALDLISA